MQLCSYKRWVTLLLKWVSFKQPLGGELTTAICRVPQRSEAAAKRDYVKDHFPTVGRFFQVVGS